jgi:hypothetical protein
VATLASGGDGGLEVSSGGGKGVADQRHGYKYWIIICVLNALFIPFFFSFMVVIVTTGTWVVLLRFGRYRISYYILVYY